jgi:hypothetical protein
VLPRVEVAHCIAGVVVEIVVVDGVGWIEATVIFVMVGVAVVEARRVVDVEVGVR